jgi:hypothetical protein
MTTSNKKTPKKKEKVETDTGKIYRLTNQTKVRCVMWSKHKEGLYGEVMDSPVKLSVFVPASYVVGEVKVDEYN